MQNYSGEQFSRDLVIFTDGSSLGNPGPGGYGCVLVFPQLGEVIELGGNKTRTTNNEMELSAVIAALSHAVFNTSNTHIFTDSGYVVNGITKWVSGWEKNNWQTKAKTDVANRPLWETLAKLVRERESSATVTWHQLPGHVGIAGNERCDAICTAFAAGKPIKLFRGTLLDYTGLYGDILNFAIDEEMAQQKSDRKARAGAKAYSYVSLVDGVAMRHATWAECEARVRGKNAKFKKALSAQEEMDILRAWGAQV